MRHIIASCTEAICQVIQIVVLINHGFFVLVGWCDITVNTACFAAIKQDCCGRVRWLTKRSQANVYEDYLEIKSGETAMSNDKRRPTTTDAGTPVASDEYSLSIGPDGPLLLHDHYPIEQMANFNRERIPERQPHAKGSGAFGYYLVILKPQKTSASIPKPRYFNLV